MLGNSFYGTQECHRATGYLGDISASGLLVLALIQWFTPGNKDVPTHRNNLKTHHLVPPFFLDSVVLKRYSESGSPGRLVKTRMSGPDAQFLIQCVWCGAWEFAFPQVTK